MSNEKHLESIDYRNTSGISNGATASNLRDADEALAFLQNHPQATAITEAGNAILEDPVQLKKLQQKIDRTIAPLLAAIYFLQFLDKTTLAYTAVMGIRKDANLKGQDYSNLSMLFYIGAQPPTHSNCSAQPPSTISLGNSAVDHSLGFLAAEFPTQFLAQHISRLGLYLGVNIMIWGVVLGCHAACTSFATLAICRTLLGIFESCVAPILVLIIAMWYKKEEQGRRVSWFYVCNSLTVIFGGLLAYGVSFTKSRFASWRIFFLATGALTIIVGALVCIFLPDSPVKAKRFTDSEKAAALIRVKGNQSGTQNSLLKKAQVIETFKDLRIYLICLATLLSSIPNAGITNFSSILLTTFGYSPKQALILGTPTGVIGVFVVLLTGWLSDKWRDRSTVMLICVFPTILAAGLMVGLDPNGVPKNKTGLLAASFLSGTSGAVLMVILAWNASNIAGHSKKVTTNALTLVSSAVGNILGTQTFQQKEAPGYISGKINIIITLSALCIIIGLLRIYNDYLNRRNEHALAQMEEAEREELREKMAFADQTDRKNIFFKYTH